MAKSKSNRSKVIDEIRNILGDGMVDVELDPEHYDLALKKSFEFHLCLRREKFL